MRGRERRFIECGTLGKEQVERSSDSPTSPTLGSQCEVFGLSNGQESAELRSGSGSSITDPTLWFQVICVESPSRRQASPPAGTFSGIRFPGTFQFLGVHCLHSPIAKANRHLCRSIKCLMRVSSLLRVWSHCCTCLQPLSAAV